MPGQLSGAGGIPWRQCGQSPKSEVHPLTIREFQRNSLRTDVLRSKDLAEFEGAGARQLDFGFTVCDQVAAEVCPVWPGHPMTAHRGVEDPTALNADDQVRKSAFAKAFKELRIWIEIFVNLPFETLSKLQSKEKLDGIGRVALPNPGEKGSQR